LEVSPGSYSRTYTNSGTGPTGEADPAIVSGFRLDKYLVTVGRFRQFVSVALPPDGGTGWLPTEGSGKHTHLNSGAGLAAAPNVDAGQTYEPGWSTADNFNIQPTDSNMTACSPYPTWTSSAGSGHENLPVDCVTWAEAYAFCIWDGGFLPSEAEWEYAAAGGSQEREYPWGSTAPGTENQTAIYDCNYPSGPSSCAGTQNIAPVGTAPLGAGAWGQLDLAGDVWEWTLDWFNSNYADPCTDCVQLNASSPYRVIHGGNFASTATYLLPPSRNLNAPATRNIAYIGFRCARTPQSG